MRTVGEILREERERKFYTLEEIEKTTKIRKELLQALEDNNWSKLPPHTFIQGFIKNYAKFLGLDPEKLLAIFRREFSEAKNPPRVLEAWTNPLSKNKFFHLTPSKFLGGLVLILVLSFFAYLWFEYRFLVGAPFLEINRPPEQQTVSESTITVEGKTDPEARVTINGQGVQVDISGKFSQNINLTDNVNIITITATSKYDKVVREERTVFLKK